MFEYGRTRVQFPNAPLKGGSTPGHRRVDESGTQRRGSASPRVTPNEKVQRNMKYDIVFKNDSVLTVEVGEEDLLPTLLVNSSNGFYSVENLPAGYSVDPSQVLYIEPVED